MKDNFFESEDPVSDFVFDAEVTKVFDNMVSRSVPLYAETHAAVLDIAHKAVDSAAGAHWCDIGCSTGTLIRSAASDARFQNYRFLGIDDSEDMVKSCRENLQDVDEFVEVVKSDFISDSFDRKFDVVSMMYTLQFIRPIIRDDFVRSVSSSLKPGGIFFLVEKVLESESFFNRTYIDVYYNYKNKVGYSNKEIAKKREALENVLIPYRVDENEKLLYDSGFSKVSIFFKWCNWAGFVAIK